MFAWIKRLLFRITSRSASAPARQSDLSAEERLDRLFAELERQSDRLVEEEIVNFDRAWRTTDK